MQVDPSGLLHQSAQLYIVAWPTAGLLAFPPVAAAWVPNAGLAAISVLLAALGYARESAARPPDLLTS